MEVARPGGVSMFTGDPSYNEYMALNKSVVDNNLRAYPVRA